MYKLFLSVVAIVVFPVQAFAGYLTGWGYEGWGPKITFGFGTTATTVLWILVICFAYAVAYLAYRVFTPRRE